MATPENLQAFFQGSTEYARQNRGLINQIWYNQRMREVDIIQSTDSFCPLSQLQNMTLRAEDAQRALQEGYGDGNILRALMCLNNSLAIYPASSDLKQNIKVRHYIRKLRQIGAESVAGYAMASTIRSKVPDHTTFEPFVVKSPRVISQESNLDQIHEYFVGAFGTNNLRDKIPNFSYIMGMFRCSPPYINERKEVETFCQNTDPEKQAVYILYENIRNSQTLADFIMKGCTLEQYLNILIQVILSLGMAYSEFRYTHEDLHDRNVLVEELPEEIFIPYPIDTQGTIGYLKTRHLARFIDLGRSYIEYNGEKFGYALYEGGVYPEKPYPMYDIYKLLMNNLRHAAMGEKSGQPFAGKMDNEVTLVNPEVFNGAKQLLEFFNPEILRDPDGKFNGVVDYLLRTQQFYFSLLYAEVLDILPTEFYTRFLIPQVRVDFISTSPPSDPDRVYGCSDKGICLTLQQALGRYSELDLNLLADPYVFYESMFEALEQGERIESLIGEGNRRFDSYMQQLKKEADHYFDEYQKIVVGLSIHSLVTPGREFVTFQDPYLEEYQRYLNKVVRAVDMRTSLETAVIIMNYLNRLYPYLAKTIEVYQIQSENLNRAIESIQRDVQYLQQVNLTDLIRINPKVETLLKRILAMAYSITA